MTKKLLFVSIFLVAYATLFAQNNMNSALSEGEVYKIAIPETGVYKLDADFFTNELQLDISSLNPKFIQIFGNEGGMLPEFIDSTKLTTERDLVQNPVYFKGEEDGVFNAQDYILFYAEGPDKLYFNELSETISKPKNIYDANNYFFIKFGNSAGLRIQDKASEPSFDHVTDEFDDMVRFEEDKANLLADWALLKEGGGQQWFGDQFNNLRTRTYDDFRFPNIVLDHEVDVEARMAGRAYGSGTSFKVEIQNETFSSTSFSSTPSSDSESTFAFIRTVLGSVFPDDEQIEVIIDYPQTIVECQGWLDYIQVNARRKLLKAEDQMTFRDFSSGDYATTKFELGALDANQMVWDISNALNPANQLLEGNTSNKYFSTMTNTELKQFILFDNSKGLKAPSFVEKVENQNLHGISEVDLVILYASDFEEPVMRLAEQRRKHHDYIVETIEVQKVYNEFSSGRLDPTAIRDFSKMLYDRNIGYKYLLLFGDGSFDARDVYEYGGNFIPVYETIESMMPIYTYPSDDYFILLDNGEGNKLLGDLDAAVGRIPVSTIDEANGVVDKILNYENDPSTLGDWRNKLVFVADDENQTGHIGPSEDIAKDLENEFPSFNQRKIYLDAYPQIYTSGGQKYPAVNEAINQSMFQGNLVINYFGHGGPKGWAQERVLKIEDIINWNNFEKLPLFVTATCTFTGYDDPKNKTAGELVFLNPKGGAIALMTTTRAVYIGSNATLTSAVFDRLFEKVDGEYLALGEMFRLGKNESNADYRNSRKFTMIGDPSMHLALPKHNIETTVINGIPVDISSPDTLRALQEVTIEGVISDKNGSILQDFNGFVYPTIYDKKIVVTTLGQDPTSTIVDFETQESILFKGKASVRDGEFSFSFKMPKDINYEYGFGKISYYAENGTQEDASGYYNNLIIGKTDPDATFDDEGPIVEVFMNNEDFIFGGITNENPVLYVKLSDDNGMNVAGTNIGHDLIAILDDDTRNTHILNDFYESELDDFTKGVAQYPLFNLEEGLHSVEVTAWDISNNFSKGYTEFMVLNSEESLVQRLLNFPNPFIDQTCFSFEHNLVGNEMEMTIDIFSIDGKHVKSIKQDIAPSGFLLGQAECVPWDGTNEYGAPLSRGVYVYRVSLKSLETEQNQFDIQSDFQKLILMKR